MLRQFPSFRRRSRAFLLAGALAAVATAMFVAAGTSSGARAKTFTIAFVSQGTSKVPMLGAQPMVSRKFLRNSARECWISVALAPPVSDCRIFSAEGDATKQLPEIQRAIATHPDAMVLVPLGQAADTGPVERAMAAGIKVILCDSKVNTQNYTSLVNPDPATATVPLAKWLAKKMHYKGNLLYVGGLPGNGTTILYDEGFHKVMKQYPNIHIVNSGNANYSISTAKQLAATAIASGKKFAASWGVGGESVTGIMQAYVDSKVRPIPPNAGAACAVWISGATRPPTSAISRVVWRRPSSS